MKEFVNVKQVSGNQHPHVHLQETQAAKRTILKANAINYSILFFIAQNVLPYSIVETESFRQLVTEMTPNFKIASRNTFVAQMENKYDGLVEVIKSKLRKTLHISITSDIWTDTHTTQQYLGITAHFIEDYIFRVINLS